jgi:hypothetical protein
MGHYHYQIEKSKTPESGRWSGRLWIVEAADEAAALAEGKRRWPSKNTTDCFHATLLTEEQLNAIFGAEWDKEIAVARRHTGERPISSRNAERIAAYYEKCGQNLQRSLDKNVSALGGVTPTITKIAERIDWHTAEKIDDAYRG